MATMVKIPEDVAAARRLLEQCNVTILSLVLKRDNTSWWYIRDCSDETITMLALHGCVVMTEQDPTLMPLSFQGLNL